LTRRGLPPFALGLALGAALGCSEPRSGAATPRPPDPAEVARAERLLALLGDIAEEYAEGGESSPEAALAAADLVPEAAALASSLPAAPGLGARVERVERAIRRLDAPFEIQDACAAIAADVVRAVPARREPAALPDLARGRRVYVAACAACHGEDGHPPPAVAQQMSVPPPDLLEAGTMNGLSPRRVYEVVTHGVRQTPMPEFPTLGEQDRWAVAFFTMSLGRPPCGVATPDVSLAELTWADDNALVARHGEAAAACLRTLSGGRGAARAGRRPAPRTRRGSGVDPGSRAWRR
jgi:mono/diheme cytochrome c family protein